MRAPSSQPITPFATVMASGFGVAIVVASVSAAAWSDIRDAALAVGLLAASQFAVWTLPSRARMLLVLEIAIGVGSVAAAILASAWFVLPAAFALATAASLRWARRIEPRTLQPEGASVTAIDAPGAGRSSMEELRAALPGVHRFYKVFTACSLVLAALFALAATAEPLLLVMTAVFLALAATDRLAAWIWVRTTPQSVRRQMERSQAERAARHEASRRNG